MAPAQHPIVLHVDADAFFCQVEVLRDASLAGKPLAIFQQYDVISVDHQARKLGVKKHMPPAQARAILEANGGRLVHAFCEGGNRVSYRPYREASGALMRLLRRFVNAAVVEKASIDEAYVLCQAPAVLGAPPDAGGVRSPGAGAPGAAAAAAPAPTAPPAAAAAAAAESWDLAPGVRLGCAIRDASRAELGIVLSVGVATNKLLAKLASRADKPDGLLALDTAAAVRRLLQQTPVRRLPGLGGQVADALEKAGLQKASDLARWRAEELSAAVGGGSLTAALSARLVGWGRGLDDAPVVDVGPAKSIQVQMTLTWANLVNHSAISSTSGGGSGGGGGGSGGSGGGVGGGGGGGGGVSGSAAAGAAAAQPLLSGRQDTLGRLGAIVGAMMGDLLGARAIRQQ